MASNLCGSTAWSASISGEGLPADVGALGEAVSSLGTPALPACPIANARARAVHEASFIIPPMDYTLPS